MPTYDYRCKACGHEFEQFQSMKDEPLKTCPVCKKKQLERLIGAGAGLIFKGSGFYITDYRSESYKQASKAESGGSSSGADGATKPDAPKPDAPKPDAPKAESKPATESKPSATPAPKASKPDTPANKSKPSKKA